MLTFTYFNACLRVSIPPYPRHSKYQADHYFICAFIQFETNQLIMSKCIWKTQKRGQTLKIIYFLSRFGSVSSSEMSSETITVDDLAVVEVKVKLSGNNTIIFIVRLKKGDNAKNLTILVNVTYEKTNQQFFCPDDWVEIVIGQKEKDYSFQSKDYMYIYTAEINITVQEIKPVALTLCDELYKDTKSMDFHRQPMALCQCTRAYYLFTVRCSGPCSKESGRKLSKTPLRCPERQYRHCNI